MHVYEIDDGEQWWYVAESKEDALRQHVAPLVPKGIDLSDLSNINSTYLSCLIEEIEIHQWNDDTLLKVYYEDGGYVEKTAREWANQEKGCVACTLWSSNDLFWL